LSWFGPQPNATTDDEVTPLLTAAAAGCSEIVELLIKKGADVNASAGGGVTPLHVAADHGDERMVDCLLAAGADPNAMDDVNYLICHSSVLMFAHVWAVYQLIIMTSGCQMLASPLLYLIVFCWPGVLCEAAK
jgi:ankyrin repeat protein